ncbi:MAG TPA: oxygen-independent coproporphyrinogen III oxidase [Bacteroidales bacterium]|nr:oxygen-independent coproporphyrinogen III oxidase [Bacteroidales bacterium]
MKIDHWILQKYNVPVPRYTSYPTADQFRAGMTEKSFIQLVGASNQHEPKYLSFYVHIPFCAKICHYCGCNALRLQNPERVIAYKNALLKEIEQVTSLIDPDRKIAQIHFGGGTPNAVEVGFIREIVDALRKRFSVVDEPEFAIECHPGLLDFPYIDQLLDIGFNRFSLGIQDFNTEVLKTVNRMPSKIPLEELITYFRKRNPKVSVNLDFMYGLPGQTVESFGETIRQAVRIAPDRLVTFSYAHVPWLKKHQQVLERVGLPSTDEKTEMFLTSREILIESGLIPIGLDHYVQPGDELHMALQEGQLHRNFQGYCTRKTTGQVYAFGVSAISQLQFAYLQNVKEVDRYIGLLEQGLFPVEKGLTISHDEWLVKEIITNLMCSGRLNLRQFATEHGLTVEEFIALTDVSFDELTAFVQDGLIEFSDLNLTVTALGSLFIRNVAAVFDPAYRPQTNRFSTSI